MNSSGDWDWFVNKFNYLSKINLFAYKRPQMERRINSFMRLVNTDNYNSFIDLLSTNKEIYRKFLEHITINVSEFFRNANHWKVMEQDILPQLLTDRSTLKIWSAGSSTGEEPYSLAILVKEKGIKLTDRILASDLDTEVLDKASIGLYSVKGIESVPAQWRSRYFKPEGSYYQVSDELKKMVKFERHDLLRDNYPGGFDLILCRNVVIYFTEESKYMLYKKFCDALRPKGIIFIGSTEQIFQARELGLQSVSTFFYQKIN